MANSLWMGFLVIYAVAKDIVIKLTSKFSPSSSGKPVKIFSILLTFLITITTSLFLAPFLIFRTILYVILTVKHGRKFAGFLKGPDNFFELKGEPLPVIGIIIYRLKDGEKSKQRELARKFVKTLHDSVYQLGMKVGTLCDYYYYIRDMVGAEDVLEFIDGDSNGYLTRNSIFDFVEKNCRLMENQIWKVRIFSQPIKWSDDGENEHGKQYAAIVTIRHCIGDGTSIMSVISKFLVKAGEGIETKKAGVNVRNVPMKEHEPTMDNVYVYRNPLTQKTEGDIFKIRGNSEWHLAAYIERKPKYFAMIRSIKEKLGVSFINVINAAMYSSLLDYMVKRGIKTDKVTASTIMRPIDKDMLKIINGVYDSKDIGNNYTMVTSNVPFETSEGSMKSKILNLQRISKSIAGGVDTFISSAILRYIWTYLPMCLTNRLAKFSIEGASLVVTNMVGCEKSTCFGCLIDDVTFSVPNPASLGFIFSFFTYDGRFSVSVSSREGYVHNREELEAILANIFRYIDQAEAEIL